MSDRWACTSSDVARCTHWNKMYEKLLGSGDQRFILEQYSKERKLLRKQSASYWRGSPKTAADA